MTHGTMPCDRRVFAFWRFLLARWKKWTQTREDEFLQWLREGHTVTYACAKLDIPHSTAYKHRSEDETFRERWDEAREAGADKLEDVALERAFAGSDRLLEFLLKGAKPEKYKDRVQAEHTGKDGGPVRIHTIVVEKPGDE